MCGICGVVNFTGEPIAEDAVRLMTDRLAHRGPDAFGVAHPLPWIGLGHRRLKVIDLSEAANQPMVNAAKTVWIVYNGEIYNYRALRQELEGHGHQFVSRSDTEVILRAYEQWGEDCVTRLDGMFAFGIVDVRQRRLLLARDRTGKKPLFYSHDSTRLAFASEIKALLAYPAMACEIRPDALPMYLTYGYVPAPETWYEGIRQLIPGSWLLVDLSSGQQQVRRYWRLPVPSQPLRVSPREAAATVRQLLTEAVRKRLESDVPLGVFLSGGIDSSIVVGLMSQLMREPVHSFSIGFRGDPRYDETSYARLVAQRFHTRHTEFVVKPDAFQLLERLVSHHDQPFGDASAIPTFLLCALAKEHVTVALNGDGGDECFAGYRRFQAAVASAQIPSAVSRFARRAIGLVPAARRGRRVGELIRFCEAAELPWEQRLVRWVSYVSNPADLLRPEWRRQLDPQTLLQPVRQALAPVAAASPLTQALAFNFEEYLPNDLHVKMDRCSMAHGLETRSPFLDTALIEYVAGLPDHLKLRGWSTKVVLKAACADLLPPAIARRGKWGFGVPLDAWFRAELRQPLQDMLLAPSARLAMYLEPQAIRHLVEAHLSGSRNLGLSLWMLLTLETWLRMMARSSSQSLASAGRRG